MSCVHSCRTRQPFISRLSGHPLAGVGRILQRWSDPAYAENPHNPIPKLQSTVQYSSHTLQQPGGCSRDENGHVIGSRGGACSRDFDLHSGYRRQRSSRQGLFGPDRFLRASTASNRINSGRNPVFGTGGVSGFGVGYYRYGSGGASERVTNSRQRCPLTLYFMPDLSNRPLTGAFSTNLLSFCSKSLFRVVLEAVRRRVVLFGQPQPLWTRPVKSPETRSQ